MLKRSVYVKVSLNLFPVSFRARDNPGYISFFVYLNEISRKLSRKIASSPRKPRLEISISSQTWTQIEKNRKVVHKPWVAAHILKDKVRVLCLFLFFQLSHISPILWVYITWNICTTHWRFRLGEFFLVKRANVFLSSSLWQCWQ